MYWLKIPWVTVRYSFTKDSLCFLWNTLYELTDFVKWWECSFCNILSLFWLRGYLLRSFSFRIDFSVFNVSLPRNGLRNLKLIIPCIIALFFCGVPIAVFRLFFKAFLLEKFPDYLKSFLHNTQQTQHFWNDFKKSSFVLYLA